MTAAGVGFFWSERYGHRYCVVVLARNRETVREYHADTVRALQRMAAAGGWRLGSRIAQSCLAHVHSTGHE